MKKRCPVYTLLNILLLTAFEISSEAKEFSSLSSYCQWGPAKYKSRNNCIEQCAKFKGFIIPESGQLVCFHDSKPAALIRLFDEETKSKQCGYKSSSTGKMGRACKPKLVCGNESDDQCSKKCSTYTVYISRSNYKYANISYCGKTSIIEPILRPLDATGNLFYVPRNDGSERNAYNCSCGFGERGKEVREKLKTLSRFKIMKDSTAADEIVATCPSIQLVYKKVDCEETCSNLKGIYSRQDDKFICFHSRWNVTALEATPEYCECGANTLVIHRQLLLNSKCPPERRIRLNNEDEMFDCPAKCANYKAHAFTPNKWQPFTVYCELPSYIYRNLSYEIGKTVVVDNQDRNKKYRKFECKCGLRLSQLEKNLKPNASLQNYGLENNERDKARNNLQTRNHSDIRGQEISNFQSFMDASTSQNEEIYDLTKSSDFLYDLIPDGENAIRNNSNDFGYPIVTKKRTSNQTNLNDVDETDRSKKRCNQLTRNSEIIQPADLQLALMSFHHTASLNNGQNVAQSLSHNVVFHPNIIQNNDSASRDIIEETNLGSDRDNYYFFPPDLTYNSSQISQPEAFDHFLISQYHMPSHDNIVYNKEKESSYLNNIGLCGNASEIMGDCPNVSINKGPSDTFQNMGLSLNTLSNMGLDPSLMQNMGFTCNDASQSMGVSNHITMYRNDEAMLRTPAGQINSTIRNEDNIAEDLLSKYANFLFPNPSIAINEEIRPAGNFDHQTPLLTIFNDDRDSIIFSQNTPTSAEFVSHDGTKDKDHLNRNTMSSNSNNASQGIPSQTRHTSHWDERNTLSYSSIPDETSYIFPDLTMEINEIIGPIVDLNPPTKFCDH